MHKYGRSCGVLAAAVLALGAGAASAGAARPSRTSVPGSVPRWAQPSRDRGDAASSKPVTITVYLPLRNAAAADALAQQVSDPDSASYGQFLTPDAIAQRFGASDADVAAVSSFLRGAGLSVGDAPANNAYVEASGTLAQAEAAFATDVHRYAYRGRVLDAPSTALSVPSSLDGKVLAVTGLDQSGVLTRPQNDLPGATTEATQGVRPGAGSGAPPPPAFVNAPPCSTYFGEKTASQYPAVNGKKVPFAPCGYTPSQYQGAYGTAGLAAKGIDGRGVTVAITDAYAAPTILEDANTYAQRHGQRAFRSGQFKQILPKKPFRYGFDDTVNGDLCDEQGWYGEETLDVEAVHAMAPGANVLYVAGRSCDDPDLLKALNTIIEKRRADIITNSWGDIGEDVPPDVLQAYSTTFVQAALEGIGVFFSSGDDGDDSLDTEDGSPAVDFPSSHPLVTAVGGTSLAVDRNNGYQFETGWATGTSALSADGTAWAPPFPGDFLYGGGGGVSSLFAEPFYQRGVVPNSIAHGHRSSPDIAMDGDPQTGMLVGETQTFLDGSVKYSEYRIGGTSLSSPLYAGIEALADQAAGHPHGFANPAIYRLAGGGVLHDIRGHSPVPAVVRVNYKNGENAAGGTTPLLRSLDDEAQSLHLTPGWDNLTGVGSPDGPGYVFALGGRGR
ncbi:MAG TPA: S53 family peptidase [Baekduia sp.]|nr:S53 family peptidase [Baekduia sp.]